MLMLYMYNCLFLFFFVFKQKTAYEMRISDWSSDVCSSDLLHARIGDELHEAVADRHDKGAGLELHRLEGVAGAPGGDQPAEGAAAAAHQGGDRQSGVWGKRVSGSVEPGGRRRLHTKPKTTTNPRRRESTNTSRTTAIDRL